MEKPPLQKKKTILAPEQLCHPNWQAIVWKTKPGTSTAKDGIDYITGHASLF